MASGWGGARPGAGQKRKADASPRRLAAARARRRARKIEALADAKDRARAFVKTFELAEVFASNDLQAKLEAWKVLKSYAEGSPSAAEVEINIRTLACSSPGRDRGREETRLSGQGPGPAPRAHRRLIFPGWEHFTNSSQNWDERGEALWTHI
jgi:hypothetical protein